MRLPAAPGSNYAICQANRPGQSQESFGQFDILHQWLIRETAHRLKGAACHKHGLIAGSDSAQARAPIHQGGYHPQQEWAAPDAHIKTPPRIFLNSPATLNGCFDRLFCRRWQRGVGMQKQQNIALRNSGASIHLPRPASLAANYLCARAHGCLPGVILTTTVHHNHLSIAPE